MGVESFCLTLVCPNKFTGVFQNEKELGNPISKHGSDYRWKKSLNSKMGSLTRLMIRESYLDSIKSMLQPIIK